MTFYSKLSLSLITGIVTFSCQAELAQVSSTNAKALTFESSLSDFKSINNESAKLSANESGAEMKDMQEMDHSKMGADEMSDMKGMDHSKMTPDEMKSMKAAPKKSANPAKVKKLEPMKKMVKPMPPAADEPTLPAPVPAPVPEVNPHQNHQM